MMAELRINLGYVTKLDISSLVIAKLHAASKLIAVAYMALHVMANPRLRATSTLLRHLPVAASAAGSFRSQPPPLSVF